MNATPYVELVMERATLDGLPVSEDSAGCAIRGYQAGDDVAWTRIQKDADQCNAITPELFAEEFGSVEKHLAQRVVFAVSPNSEPIGTAAAWWGASPADRWGRVHWIAVLPAYQRRGIGRRLVKDRSR